MDVLVVGSGNMESVELLRQTAALAELLICVDGGARYFQKADITPHVLLGDFDSIEQDTLRAYETEGVEVVRFSPRKDYTDMELALNYAVEHGATRIFIMGATGSRVDHSISNVQLLHKLLDADAQSIILDDKTGYTLIKDKITIGRMEGYKLSLVCHTGSREHCNRGLVWPLFNYTMKMGAGIGISNEFSEDKATVRIGSGRMYVILSKD